MASIYKIMRSQFIRVYVKNNNINQQQIIEYNNNIKLIFIYHYVINIHQQMLSTIIYPFICPTIISILYYITLFIIISHFYIYSIISYYIISIIMTKIFLFALAFIALLSFHQLNTHKDQYQSWKTLYSYQFEPQQDIFRRAIFMNTLKLINQFNSKTDRTYQQGINQFSHLTDQEFALNYLTKSQAPIQKTIIPVQKSQVTATDIDWVLLGKVSRVKDQGTCDAGYAFSSTSLFESYTRIKNNNNTQFSEQQFVDCSKSYGTDGCQGGSRSGALQYVKANGISFQSQYPFRGVVGTCRNLTGSFKFNNYGTVTGCDDIATALRTSPLTIAADATNWRSYKSGIFNNCSQKVTHDVLLVGQTTTYWKIKNSWGLSWGQYGYIRIALGNTCGICGIKAFWITD